MPSYVKRTMRLTILMIIFFELLFLFTVKNPKPWCMGLLFGGSVSVLMFWALYATVNKMVDKEPEAGKRYAVFAYVLRMGIYTAVLVVAAMADYLNLYTTFLGLLTTKFAIQTDNVLQLFKERR